MAYWRPVDVRLWNDRKFLACSDDARMLWLFLLTCPSLPIPGVVIGGDAALAEQLGWLPERLREGFQVLTQSGLQVRREGKIAWLPNALKYQPPANPNMVKGWAKKWDDVPEGSLKIELWQALRIACKSWSGLFAKGFPEPLPEQLLDGSRNHLGTGSTHKHDHKHNHKHEHDPVLRVAPLASLSPPESVPVTPSKPRTDAGSPHARVIAEFDRRYRERFPGKPTWGAKQGAQVNRLLKAHGADEVMRRIAVLFDSPPAFLARSPPDIGTLEQHFDKLVEATRVAPGARGRTPLELQLERVAMLEREEHDRGKESA